ncbi:MAG: xylulokinase [Candidatus Helarchaeales archaeon]
MKGSNKYVLAIDHGTSGVKTAIISMHGKVLDFEYEATPLYLFDGGGVEQDPAEWWDAFLKSAKRLLDKELVSIDNIVAISTSAQWSCTVPVDEQGNHLMNSISWMDTRGAPYIRKVAKGIINISGYGLLNVIRWIHKTGGGPTLSGKDPIAHILFIKNEFPDIYQKTFKFLDAKDFFNLKLTGKFASTFETITIHWVTNTRDINNIFYEKSLIRKFGIDREKLPDLIRAIDILGTIKKDVADELGLNKDVKVVGGAPDIPMAAIGAGTVEDYAGHVYIGTSAFCACHVPFRKTDIAHNMASLPSALPGKYFLVTEQETAGGCLAFLRDNILYHKDVLLKEEAKPDVYKIFDKIVEQVPPGSNKVLFTPWLCGERTPIENHTVRGSLMNISLSTTRAEIIRAIFEGVAFNTRWVLKYVDQFIKRKMEPINIIGGGANSDIWCQIYADVLNRTIRKVKEPIQANARGAAFLAAISLGYISVKDIPQLIEFERIFKPNPQNREIYDELFKEFLNIYKNNKKMYARLNSH